jgi:uncharacterized membrane protein YjfL (UPF0719 family)
MTFAAYRKGRALREERRGTGASDGGCGHVVVHGRCVREERRGAGASDRVYSRSAMDDLEGAALLASGGSSLVFWGSTWFYPARSRHPMVAPRWARVFALAVPALALAIVLWGLRTLAASDVRESALYTTFYLVMGAGWTGAIGGLSGQLFGVQFTDDVLERHNLAAALALAGLVLGSAMAFAGGNVGDGPGWWVVVASATLSTSTLVAVWWLLHRVARVPERITVDRDMATGVRMFALTVAVGAVAGRAVAGDWRGYGDLFVSFAKAGWPAGVLAALAAVIEQLAAPTPERPRPSVLVYGLPPAAVYVGTAVLTVAALGLPG